MNKTMRFFAVAAGALFTLSGCAQNTFSGVFSAQPGALSGTFEGVNPNAYVFRMTVHQNGANAFGDWYIANGNTQVIRAGSMTGIVNGNTMQANLQAIPALSYSATLTLSGNAATVNLTGTNTTTQGTLSFTQ